MKSTDNAEIVERIKLRAKSKGITMKYLCDQFGLARNYFSDVARGKNSINDERLEKIAYILDTSIEYLICETDEPEADELERELDVYREMYITRPEIRKLYSVIKNAKKEDIEKIIKIMEAYLSDTE